MRYLDADTVHQLLDYPGLVEAMRQAHLGAEPNSGLVVVDEPAGGKNKFVSHVSWQRDELIAVKLVGVFPSNVSLDPPQPSVQGIVATFDAATGTPKLAADGAAMTFRKTAADSALGASLLASNASRTLLIVGAGGLAPHVLAAHCAVRPALSRVMIWNRTAERALALADATNTPDLSVVAVEDLDAAVSQADIISCVTMSNRPLVRGALLKPGAHLDLIGAYRKDMREADDEAMCRAALFVDTRNGAENAGDLAQPVAKGLFGWDAVRADLFELIKGQIRGRETDEQITLFKNVGGGHLDLFTAQYLSEQNALTEAAS